MKTIVIKTKNKPKAKEGGWLTSPNEDILNMGQASMMTGNMIGAAGGYDNPTATIASRALQMGGMGAAFGPIGAGVGALAGAGIGLVEANKIKKEEEERKKKEAEQEAILAQNRGILLSMNANPDGSPYAFAYGGRLPGSNTPGGVAQPLADDISKLNGNTHEEGGIDIGPVEAEDGEVIAGDFVFSNRLEESNGRTFAMAAEPISKRIGLLEERLKGTTDTYKINGYNRLIQGDKDELKVLFDKQEQQKQMLAQQQQQMQMMQQQQGQSMMALGGKIHAANGLNLDGEDDPFKQKYYYMSEQDANNLSGEEYANYEYYQRMRKADEADGITYNPNPIKQTPVATTTIDPLNKMTPISAKQIPINNVSISTPQQRNINVTQTGVEKSMVGPTADDFNKMEADLRSTTMDKVVNKDNIGSVLNGLLTNNQSNEYFARMGTSLDNVVNAILAGKTPQIPIPEYLDPVLLKTKTDTTAQRQAIEGAAENTKKLIAENTSDSNRARALMVGTNIEKAKALTNVAANAANVETQLENQSRLNLAGINEKNAAKKEGYDMNVAKRLAGIQGDMSKNVANAQDDLMWNVQRTDLNNYQKAQLMINAIQNPNTAVNFSSIYNKAFGGADEETRYQIYEALVTGGLKDDEYLKTIDPTGDFKIRFEKKQKGKQG